MRTLIQSAALTAALAAPALAQEGAAAAPVNILAPDAGLMFWTLIIFGVFVFFARPLFKKLTELTAAREQSLRDALAAAKRDRDDSARVLAEHRAQLEAARAEGQKLITDSRAVADKLRASMLEETKKQQDELLARARRDIDSEKTKAILELRTEAIDLALKGASRVIEKNLDDATNRKLVEEFLNSVTKH